MINVSFKLQIHSSRKIGNRFITLTASVTGLACLSLKWWLKSPQWGYADAEIRVPFAESPELPKDCHFKALGLSLIHI